MSRFIFNYKTDKLISINIKELILGQLSINQKFPNPNEDNPSFVNLYDNMAGQIAEEVYETKESIYKNVIKDNNIKPVYQSEESLEEFVDSIMYLGSLFIETAKYFKIDIIKFLEDNKLSEVDIYDFYIANNIIYNKRNYPSVEFLSHIRRMIYDRKYHKAASAKVENYEENLLKSMIISSFYPRKDDMCYATKFDYFKIPSFIDNINPFLQDILFCYDNGMHSDTVRQSLILPRVKELNKIIREKQEKITNLTRKK